MNRPGLDMGSGMMQQGGPATRIQPTNKFQRFMPPGGAPRSFNEGGNGSPMPNAPSGPRGDLFTQPGVPSGQNPFQPLPNGPVGMPRPQPLPGSVGTPRPQPLPFRPQRPPMDKFKQPGIAPNPQPQRGVGLDMGDGMGIYQEPRPMAQPQAQMAQPQIAQGNPQIASFFQAALNQGFTPEQINHFLANQRGGQVGFQQ